MNKSFFVVLCLFCVSCGGGEKTNVNETPEIRDTVSKDTVAAEIPASDTNVIDASLPFPEKISAFRTKHGKAFADLPNEVSVLPDRFSNVMVQKFAWKQKSAARMNNATDVYPIAYFFFYEYADTTSLQNVKSNWYNCFGTNCKPIEVGKKLKNVETDPSFTIVTQKEIVHITYKCDGAEEVWKKIETELKQLFSDKKSEMITVNCSGNLLWQKP